MLPGDGWTAAPSVPRAPQYHRDHPNPVTPLVCQKQAAPEGHIPSGARETRPCRGPRQFLPPVQTAATSKGSSKGLRCPRAPPGAKTLTHTGSQHSGEPGRAARLGAAPALSCCKEQRGRKQLFLGFFFVAFWGFFLHLACSDTTGSPSLELLAEQRKSRSSHAAARGANRRARPGHGRAGGTTRNPARFVFIFKPPGAGAPGAAARAGLGSLGFGPCGLGGAVVGGRMSQPTHPHL